MHGYVDAEIFLFSNVHDSTMHGAMVDFLLNSKNCLLLFEILEFVIVKLAQSDDEDCLCFDGQPNFNYNFFFVRVQIFYFVHLNKSDSGSNVVFIWSCYTFRIFYVVMLGILVDVQGICGVEF